MNALDGALVALLVAAICGVACLSMVLEWWLLAHNRPPITSYTRNAVVRWPGPTLMVGFLLASIIGALFAHFVWDALCG